MSSSYGAIGKLADADNEHPLKQNLVSYTQALNAAVRGLYRMGIVFSHLLTPPQIDQADDDTILVLVGVFRHFGRNSSGLLIWRMVVYLQMHVVLFLKL